MMSYEYMQGKLKFAVKQEPCCLNNDYIFVWHILVNGMHGVMFMYVKAGSLIDAMAEAVEKAAIVVICLTEKYKESPNCRHGN